ncbi:MAG TPA: flagellar type III secretion system pore protein FliP [bacterium]|nr:flagellar type III secretion system pore protein FliP [bacterium]
MLKPTRAVLAALIITSILGLWCNTGVAFAQAPVAPPKAPAPPAAPAPSVTLTLGDTSSPDTIALTLKLMLLLTVLTLAPAILVLLTSFTRIIIVFHFLRQAIGTQSTPPNTILVGLALFLTYFIMSPVINQVYSDAFLPLMNNDIGYQEAFNAGMSPIRQFMLKQTKEKDIALFVHLAKEKRPAKPDDVSNKVLVPAFVLSELKTAFQIGFLIFVPFLIIDMVVAAVLLSMGMMMLPPVMVSLPFKILLFVMVDGWYLIVGSLARSFH